MKDPDLQIFHCNKSKKHDPNEVKVMKVIKHPTNWVYSNEVITKIVLWEKC